MIVQIATHWFKPERRAAGIRGLLETGGLQHRQPGFVSRQVAVAKDDPLQVVSVTTWRSLADVEAFRADPDRLVLHHHLAQNYARPTKQEWFELIEQALC